MMIIEPRRRKSSTVTFSVPYDHTHHPYYAQRTSSFTESDWDYEPTITTISPTAVIMARALRSVKTFKKSWDSDKALKSTYQGKVGKHQLRAYLVLLLGYAVVVAWLAEMPIFALLPPNEIDCPKLQHNRSAPAWTATTARMTTQTARTNSRLLNSTTEQPAINRLRLTNETVYNYSRERSSSVLTDFNNTRCNEIEQKIPHFVHMIGLILGGLVFGYMADHSGRKMILLGSMWAACLLSVFQLLSDDYISYVFFSLFVGLAVGAVQVIAVPFVIEMFPIESRAIYGLLLTAAVFLFDLLLPLFGFAINNWKIMQGVITIPLIFTAVLYWFSEESMFWYTTQKDYVTAVLSLTKIARFNGIVFEDIFREAKDFLRGKRSKGIQCDFQPLLRLEDIKSLGSKYPDFDMVDLQTTSGKKSSFTQRVAQVLTGHHYYPTLSTFYPTDYLHSPILTIYLLLMCGLWLVSALTEYSLDAPSLTVHISNDFFLRQFYKYLIQVGSFVVAFPMVYIWGRRWPTFCFFLVAEVCLLGSFAVRYDAEDTRLAVLIVYFMGKFASRGGFVVILQYTCEIFPTGLRCTTLGICYMFRLIGMALASKDMAGFNDRMPRLVYGILALVLGSMALLLPETKKFPLPRTMVQVEVIPTSVSKKFRRHRSLPVKRNARPDGGRAEGGAAFNDAASSASGMRSVRFGPYDNQSTLHSVYELQEFGQDDTVYSASGRNARRVDSRNPTLFQPYSGSNAEAYRQQQQPIAEEYDEDVDDDRTRYAQQQRLTGQQLNSLRADEGMVVPTAGSLHRLPSNDASPQLERTAQIQSGDIMVDRQASTPPINDENKQDEGLSASTERLADQNPAYRPNLDEDENYFSEHC